jgi:hypothetical protein
MKKSKFTEQQIVLALQQAEGGTCRGGAQDGHLASNVPLACTRFRRHRVRCFLGDRRWVMERQRFTREFKLEAVRLIRIAGSPMRRPRKS